jgi:hypothetical protein
LRFVDSGGVGNQAGDGFAVTRDGDFLAVFDPVQEHPELVFRFKGSDFHGSSP